MELNPFKNKVEVFEISAVEFIKQNKNANAEDIWEQLEDIALEQNKYTCTLFNILML